jgi:hypothetical protein
MSISLFSHPLRPAASSTESASSLGGRWRRYRARHRLSEAERRNLREYYRRNPAPPLAVMTASLGGHCKPRRRR